jgi:mandelate racemase
MSIGGVSDRTAPFLAEPLQVRDGVANAPDTPGNGLAWDEAAVKKYAI